MVNDSKNDNTGNETVNNTTNVYNLYLTQINNFFNQAEQQQTNEPSDIIDVSQQQTQLPDLIPYRMINKKWKDEYPFARFRIVKSGNGEYVVQIYKYRVFFDKQFDALLNLRKAFIEYLITVNQNIVPADKSFPIQPRTFYELRKITSNIVNQIDSIKKAIAEATNKEVSTPVIWVNANIVQSKIDEISKEIDMETEYLNKANPIVDQFVASMNSGTGVTSNKTAVDYKNLMGSMNQVTQFQNEIATFTKTLVETYTNTNDNLDKFGRLLIRTTMKDQAGKQGKIDMDMNPANQS